MVTSGHISDDNWGSISELDDEGRLTQTVARFSELAGLSEEERQRRLTIMAHSEYQLPDEKLRLTTLSRMRALLKLEPDRAKTVISSYDSVMRQMPGQAAWRRASLVQTLAVEFSADEEAALRELIPTIFGGAPRRNLALDDSSSLQTAVPTKKKPFWAVWRKG